MARFWFFPNRDRGFRVGQAIASAGIMLQTCQSRIGEESRSLFVFYVEATDRESSEDARINERQDMHVVGLDGNAGTAYRCE